MRNLGVYCMEQKELLEEIKKTRKIDATDYSKGKKESIKSMGDSK